MNAGIVISGAVIMLIFLPVAVWAASYEQIENTPEGYRVITVKPEAQALFWFLTCIGIMLFLIGLVIEGPSRKALGSMAQAPIHQGAKNFCPHCGQRSLGTPFCPHCGHGLS